MLVGLLRMSEFSGPYQAFWQPFDCRLIGVRVEKSTQGNYHPCLLCWTAAAAVWKNRAKRRRRMRMLHLALKILQGFFIFLFWLLLLFFSRKNSWKTINRKMHCVWKWLKISHFHFNIDLSGNTVWQLQIFKKLAQIGTFLEFLMNFCPLYLNVNVARFARNVEWDFLCVFQILCLWFVLL